ncbi:MAG: amidase family protein, partial [Alphaproteobacteria bacterium]|nr:amidase family protein [Alphaproteobacteria bacterium]
LPALDWPGYDPSAARKAALLVIEAEAFAALGIPDGASDELRGFLDYGAKLAPERLAAAREMLRPIREGAAERIGDAVIVAPVAPCGPFPRSRKAPASQAELLAFANLTGLPALAFPCGRMANGMPFALQAIAGPGREAALVAASRTFGAGVRH